MIAKAGCGRAGFHGDTRPDDRARRRDQGRWPSTGRTTSGCLRVTSSRTCPPRATSSTPTTRDAAVSRCSATPRRSEDPGPRRWPGTAPRRSDRWAPTPRSRRCRMRRGGCSTTSIRLSRPGHQPAAGRHPGVAGAILGMHDLGPRATCSNRDRQLPADRHAVPAHRQRRAGQALSIERGRDLPGFKAVRVSGLSRCATGRRASRPADPDLPTCGGDRGRVRIRCCPTATPRRPGADPVVAAHRCRHQHLVGSRPAPDRPGGWSP